jgi:hypothetical protein
MFAEQCNEEDHDGDQHHAIDVVLQQVDEDYDNSEEDGTAEEDFGKLTTDGKHSLKFLQMR